MVILENACRTSVTHRRPENTSAGLADETLGSRNIARSMGSLLQCLNKTPLHQFVRLSPALGTTQSPHHIFNILKTTVLVPASSGRSSRYEFAPQELDAYLGVGR